MVAKNGHLLSNRNRPQNPGEQLVFEKNLGCKEWKRNQPLCLGNASSLSIARSPPTPTSLGAKEREAESSSHHRFLTDLAAIAEFCRDLLQKPLQGIKQADFRTSWGLSLHPASFFSALARIPAPPLPPKTRSKAVRAPYSRSRSASFSSSFSTRAVACERKRFFRFIFSAGRSERRLVEPPPLREPVFPLSETCVCPVSSWERC